MAAKEIFQNLRRILDDLHAQLRTIDEGRPGTVRQAVSYVAVWGRSVTFVLQNLRSWIPQFDEWYVPYKQEMTADPLLKFFRDLRNESLKTGYDSIEKSSYEVPGGPTISVRRADSVNVSKEILIGGTYSLTPSGLFRVCQGDPRGELQVVQEAPAGTSGCFIDDSGVGWIVTPREGGEHRVYAPIPDSALRQTVEFIDPPKTHLGRRLTDISALILCALYVGYLQNMVDDAAKHFVPE